MRHGLFAAATVAALTGCGGGGGGGGEPQPTPASVSVTAAGNGTMASFGDTRALSAVVRDASGNAIGDAAVSWTSTPVGVVTLSGTSGASVNAAAAGNGSATVRATSGTATGQVVIDVAQRLSTVAAAPSPIQVSVGGTRQITATARDARDNAITSASGFTYATSDAAVATVSGSGLVTGVANGSATVTVSLVRDGVTAERPVPVTVAAAPATVQVTATSGNSFNPASVEVAAGGTVTWVFQAEHNVGFSTAGAPEDIGNTSSGSVTRVFSTVGTFAYRCSLHSGMSGQVVVR